MPRSYLCSYLFYNAEKEKLSFFLCCTKFMNRSSIVHDDIMILHLTTFVQSILLIHHSPSFFKAVFYKKCCTPFMENTIIQGELSGFLILLMLITCLHIDLCALVLTFYNTLYLIWIHKNQNNMNKTILKRIKFVYNEGNLFFFYQYS